MSLGDIGDTSAVPALIECLDDVWWRLPLSSINALGEIRDPRAIPALTRLLKGDDADLAGRAASALEEIGTRDARSAVKSWRQRGSK